jgi:hypothetical protein
MRLAKFLTAVAVASLATAPVMAESANSATKLSVAKTARAATPARQANEAVGGFLIPLLAIIAVIGGALAATGGSSEPDSP